MTDKINENLPLKAHPIRELVRNFRNNGYPITLKTELKITSAYNTYKRVLSNQGSAGVDQISMEVFDADRSKQLYKLWNRMLKN